MIELRPYQLNAIARIREASARVRAVLCVSPTGSGKTTIASEIVRRTVDRGRKALWLAHRTELIDQAYDRLREFGLSVGTVSASVSPTRPPNPFAPVQVASIQTLIARKLRPQADVVIWDECHHSPSDLWSGIAADYSAAHIIGFTATPERSDGRGLGNVFQRLVVAASVRELVDLGHLVPCEIMRPESKLRPGSIAQRPVDAYLKHAQGRKTICFSPSIVAAEIHLDEFKQAGIRARLVHSKLPVAERIQSLDDFRSGRVDVLLNVYVLTEGFDVPATDCVILARGCGTAGTYLQMVGRGLRPAPGKQDCLLVDLHGVSHVHGKPDDDRQYSLDGRGIRSANELVVDGQSSCRVCGAPIVSGEACPECGAEPKQITPPKVTGEQLVPYASKRAESDDKRVATLARWIAEGRSRGFKPNWAHVKFKAVYGLYPPGHIQNQALEQLRSREADNDGINKDGRVA